MAVLELDHTQAIIAPGQGSQRVGMGLELAQISLAAFRVWRDSDRALFPNRGCNFSNLVWNGTMEELTRTENAQPAIIISSLARIAALKEAGLYGKPYWRSGNSLGFIVAVRDADVIDIEGTVLLGEARGKALQYVVDTGAPSILMAVQNDEPEVVEQLGKDLCTRFHLYQALLNTRNQIVLGGEVTEIEAAKTYVTEHDAGLGNQLKILPVAAAFHTPLMQSGVSIYEEAVDRLNMKDPVGGLIAGSTLTPLITIADIRRALVAQFTTTENWRGVVEFLRDQGVTTMIELGEPPTLSDMNRRLLGGKREKIEMQGITVGWKWEAPIQAEESELPTLQEKYDSVEEMETFLEIPAPKTYEGVLLWYCKWTALRTGQDLKNVDPDGNFVDDLGMDSLDYSVLRADVQGVFKRLVNEDEAKDNVTPALAAKATYGLMSADNQSFPS